MQRYQGSLGSLRHFLESHPDCAKMTKTKTKTNTENPLGQSMRSTADERAAARSATRQDEFVVTPGRGPPHTVGT